MKLFLTVTAVLSLFLISTQSDASRWRRNPTPQNPPASSKPVSFKAQLEVLASVEAQTVLRATQAYITDEVREKIENKSGYEIVGREEEVQEVMNSLIRIKGRNPILLGDAGSGKTAIVEGLAQKIVRGEYPDRFLYIDEFKDAVIIQTSPGSLSQLAKSNANSAQASAVELYFKSVLSLQKQLDKRIIVFVDEIHTLDPAQIESLKVFTDSSSSNSVRLIGASTSREFQNTFKRNEASLRRFYQVAVRNFTLDEVVHIVMTSMLPAIQKKYSVSFSEEAIRVLAQNSTKLIPEGGRLNSTFSLLQSIATKFYGEGFINETLEERDVYDYINEKLGYSVDPLDGSKMREFRGNVIQELESKIKGQNRMIEDTVEQMMDLLRDPVKGVRSVLISGPTGTGKSKLGREIPRIILKNERAFFEIDVNAFKEGGFANGSLFGVPTGVSAGRETSGEFIDWLKDPAGGKYGGVVLVNEFEKGPKDFREKFMEMIDTGIVTSGDGKRHALARHLFIFTSNRGVETIYPNLNEGWTEERIDSILTKLSSEDIKKAFREDLSRGDTISPEVMARFDVATIAAPLTIPVVIDIAQSYGKTLVQQRAEELKIEIVVDPEIYEVIAKEYFNIESGARPVERAVRKYIGRAINAIVEEYEVKKGDKISLSLDNSKEFPAIRVEHKSDVHFITLADVRMSQAIVGEITTQSVRSEEGFRVDQGGTVNSRVSMCAGLFSKGF